jgi:hypothetical protein
MRMRSVRIRRSLRETAISSALGVTLAAIAGSISTTARCRQTDAANDGHRFKLGSGASRQTVYPCEIGDGGATLTGDSPNNDCIGRTKTLRTLAFHGAAEHSRPPEFPHSERWTLRQFAYQRSPKPRIKARLQSCRSRRNASAARKFAVTKASYQGTTSVVPIQTKRNWALAPVGY